MPVPQKRPHTPPEPAASIDRTIGTRAPGGEYSTPHRTALKTVVWWGAQKSPLHRIPKAEIFRKLQFTHTQAYLVLKDQLPGTETARTFQNNPLRDTAIRRGPRLKIPKVKIDQMEDIIKNCGWEGRTLTWSQLKEQVELEDCSDRLIRETMGDRGYHICKACKKPYICPDLADRRKKWAEDMKAKYPHPESWRRVRFSDECHGSFGPEGQCNVIRKAGQRDHPDCIQEFHEPKSKKKREEAQEEQPKVHWWAACGYDFKSDVRFYNTPSNSNGKMSHRVYIDQILKPVVLPWIMRGDDFVLEEDGDSGHGYNKNNTMNIVKQWKQEHGLETYKNCAESPDFSPVENAWHWPKKRLREAPHWDESTMKELVVEGWESLKQETINHWVDEMPKRLQKCIDRDGRRTAY
jgi:hypothetical protein